MADCTVFSGLNQMYKHKILNMSELPNLTIIDTIGSVSRKAIWGLGGRKSESLSTVVNTTCHAINSKPRILTLIKNGVMDGQFHYSPVHTKTATQLCNDSSRMRKHSPMVSAFYTFLIWRRWLKILPALPDLNRPMANLSELLCCLQSQTFVFQANANSQRNESSIGTW